MQWTNDIAILFHSFCAKYSIEDGNGTQWTRDTWPAASPTSSPPSPPKTSVTDLVKLYIRFAFKVHL